MSRNPLHGAAETVDRGLLVRYLHGELEEGAAGELERHLDACGTCRELADALEARERRVAGALRSADHSGPDATEWRAVLRRVRVRAARRRRGVRLLRAAGWALAFLAAGTLAVAPVRAWVTAQWHRVVGGGPPPAAAPAPAPGREPGQAALAFRPAGASLDIVVEATQEAGILTLRFGDGERVRVSVAGGGEERLTVGERGLRIVNVSTSRADYEVDLPSAVTRVTVRIGGLESVEVTRRTAAAAPLAIDLSRGAIVRNPPSRDIP